MFLKSILSLLFVSLLSVSAFAKPGSDGFLKNPSDAAFALFLQIDNQICFQIVGKANKVPLAFPTLTINGVDAPALKKGLEASNKRPGQKMAVTGVDVMQRQFKIESKDFTELKFCINSDLVPVYSDTPEVVFSVNVGGTVGSITAPNTYFTNPRPDANAEVVVAPDFSIVVKGKDGQPVTNWSIELIALNSETESYTLANVSTNEKGIAEVKGLKLRKGYSVLMLYTQDGDVSRSSSIDVSDAQMLEALKANGSIFTLTLTSR